MNGAPPLLPSINARTVTEQVCALLRERILSGELRDGTTLRQEKIAMELGVSRNPVREAFQQLAADGLVDLVTHKGAVVSRLTSAELREAYELRAKLEGWLLSLSIPAMTQADLARSEQLAERLEEQFPDEEWSRRNWDFHVSLLEPSRRKITIEVCRKMYLNAYRHFPVPIRLINRAASIAEHAHLIELCRQRDVFAAVALLEHHIQGSVDALIHRLELLRGDKQEG